MYDAERLNRAVKEVMARTSDKGSDEQKLRKCLKDYQEMTFTEMVNYYL